MRDRPTAFLDTNVIVSYLRNKGSAARIFDPKLRSRVRYAINPIVMQELFLVGDSAVQQKIVGLIEQNDVYILDVPSDYTEHILERARSLRNRLAHTNDFLILASASDCDFLITQDKVFNELIDAGRPIVMSPEQFVAEFLEAP
ncbi:PIN domain-containing protein [Rhizobium laguerreae]|uniref:PIN domain-containing protein n=1 Tax=Rhizobium laguerreae TaxID=1076926 RepID=UPI001C913B0F|nr:PIN domain-containing protein [Rhizobium laguerreae]MBY3154464.1 PIN domain-containing protein [Rhizobium laguerreae]